MIDAHIQLNSDIKSLELLDDALEFSGVSGVFFIQSQTGEAANKVDMTLAKESEGMVCGIIPSAPLTDERLLHIQLDKDCHEDLIVGYHADLEKTKLVDWLNDEDITNAIRQISAYDMPLDLMLSPGQMMEIIPFLDTHPGLQIVLDHCVGAPSDCDNDWLRLLREAGRRPHVFYRLSGLTTAANGESAYEITESVKKGFDAALDSFGADRIFYGSGWPKSPVSYPAWLNTVDNLTSNLSEDERTEIYVNNAEKVYGIQS